MTELPHPENTITSKIKLPFESHKRHLSSSALIQASNDLKIILHSKMQLLQANIPINLSGIPWAAKEDKNSTEIEDHLVHLTLKIWQKKCQDPEIITPIYSI